MHTAFRTLSLPCIFSLADVDVVAPCIFTPLLSRRVNRPIVWLAKYLEEMDGLK